MQLASIDKNKDGELNKDIQQELKKAELTRQASLESSMINVVKSIGKFELILSGSNTSEKNLSSFRSNNIDSGGNIGCQTIIETVEIHEDEDN